MDPTLQATQTGSLSKPFRAPRGGIAVALLARVLLFSTVVTLVVTTVQLMLSYQAEVSGLQSRFNETCGLSTVNSLRASLTECCACL